MQCILVNTQKGGVGKSTTAHAMASGLYNRGYRVLAIDSDPQCNFSFISGITNTYNEAATLLDVYNRTKSAEECLIHTEAGYDLICGNLNLTSADSTFGGLVGREKILGKALRSIQDDYDFCVIDLPPFLGLLVQNCIALSSADIIIPANPDALSAQALSFYVNWLEDIKNRLDVTDTNISGVLLTKINNVNAQSATEKEMLEVIENGANALGLKVFQTRIRQSNHVPAAMLNQQDIFSYAPKSKPAADYNAFIDEYLEGKNHA